MAASSLQVHSALTHSLLETLLARLAITDHLGCEALPTAEELPAVLLDSAGLDTPDLLRPPPV